MKLPPTSYAVLGMLSLAPMSGYELTASVDKTIAHFWTISKSQVYGELSRLEELGLVTGTDVAQERAPDKRSYELTSTGAEVLDTWLVSAVAERSRLRSPQLLKMFFAHRLDRERFEALLDRYRSEAEVSAEQLKTIVDILEATPEAYYARATAVVGLRSAEGVLAAIDEIASDMPSTRTRSNVDARKLFESTPNRRKGRS